MLETILNSILWSIAIMSGIIVNYMIYGIIKEVSILNGKDSRIIKMITFLLGFIVASLDLGALAVGLSLLGFIK